MRGRGKRRVLPVAVVLVSLLVAAGARAELVERGDLFIKFQGGIFPTALPRDAHAPITVSIDGTIRTLSGQHPPALRFISIAINRGGRIDTRGLPRCRRSQLEPATSEQALAACRPALVGEGHYEAQALALPEQFEYLRGRVLAFNGVIDGKAVILAHVYGINPTPNSRVFVFHIHHAEGTFGTILTATLPTALNRTGYLKQISLNLRRDFVYRGREHSYVSAACEAPAGFNGAVFPFARVGMTFADQRKLSSTLTRSCQVRQRR
jgi:hypothetical protein